MSTEAIRAKYRELVKYLKDNKLDKPSDTTDFDIYKDGYQKAVKDMCINIQPIITAINMLERDGTTVRDEISDELRELVDKIKEFQS